MKISNALVLGCLLLAGLGCKSATTPAPQKPLELVSPKGGGGQVYKVGETVTIQWRINDASKISSVGIKLSLDNGNSWCRRFPPDTNCIDVDLELQAISPPATSFAWKIDSNQVTQQAVIKVYEYQNHNLFDVSSTFSIALH